MTTARCSHLLIPTLREEPAEGGVASHRLLVRAGFIRQPGASSYAYLPLAVRTLSKIEAIIREAMNASGALELRLPLPRLAGIAGERVRGDEGDEVNARPRYQRESSLKLGLTDAAFAATARQCLRSYRDLPQIWYQFHRILGSDSRSSSGLLTADELTMLEAWSLAHDQASLDRSYQLCHRAAEGVFARCGVDVVVAGAQSRLGGQFEATEFLAPSDSGTRTCASCPACGYAATLEIATSRLEPIFDDVASASDPLPFPTPGVTTIDALSRPPYNVAAWRQLKTLVYLVDDQPVVAVLRGDHQLQEAKLLAATGASAMRPARLEEIVALMAAHPGSLGAVRFARAPVYVDECLVGRGEMVTGANEDGFHLRHVSVDRDLLGSGARQADLRTVRQGEGCPHCPGALRIGSAFVLGHLAKFGTSLSETLGLDVLNASGVKSPILVGSCDLAIERILAVVVERHHDADGIIWPISIAPFHVAVLRLSLDREVSEAADQVVVALDAAGLDVLYDDRDERPGVKFKDADLIGLPIRIAVGRQGLAQNRSVEWKPRERPGASDLVPIDQVVAKSVELLRLRLAAPVDRATPT